MTTRRNHAGGYTWRIGIRVTGWTFAALAVVVLVVAICSGVQR